VELAGRKTRRKREGKGRRSIIIRKELRNLKN